MKLFNSNRSDTFTESIVEGMPLCSASVTAPVADLVYQAGRQIAKPLQRESGDRVGMGDLVRRREHAAVPIVVFAAVSLIDSIPAIIVIVADSGKRIVADGGVYLVHGPCQGGLHQMACGRIAPHIRTRGAACAHEDGERHCAHKHEREHAEHDEQCRSAAA